MRLTVHQLKRIIKEAVSDEKRAAYNLRRREKAAGERQSAEEKRVSNLNMPPKKEEMLVDFIHDLHSEFGHTFGDEGGEMAWEDIMGHASQLGVRTTPDEIERVMSYSDLVDDSLRYLMHTTDNGIYFENPMSL